MATPTIREVVSAVATGGASATVNTGAGTAVDDTLVCFAGNDWSTASGYGPPTGTAGTWTLKATGDNGSNTAHLKVYTRPVTVAGTQTVTVAPSVDGEEAFNTTFVLVGADLTDPSDGAAGGNGTTGTSSQVAPAVSPSTADALLLCGVQADSTASSAAAYTPPAGMTEQSDLADGTFSAGSTASLVLTASGSTGTKTFTLAPNATPYASASIAVKGAAAAAGTPRPPVVPTAAVQRAATY